MLLSDAIEGRSNNLNLIRLVAALAVIYGHAAAITGNGPPDFFLQYVGYKFIGGVAVDVFFVISGFLVTRSAMSEKGVRYYLASRTLRIYPALVTCILLTTLVLGPLLTGHDGYWHQPGTWRYLVNNATAFRTEYFLPGVFQELHDKGVNGSLWSLAVEVRLYLITLGIAVVGIFARRALFNTLFYCAMILGHYYPGWLQEWVPHQNHLHVMGMFLMGSFAWINRDRVSLSPTIGFALIAFCGALLGTDGFAYAYFVALPYLVLSLAFSPRPLNFGARNDYSYGVYLYGWIAQQLTVSTLPGLSNVHHTIVASALALACGAASWHLVEKPALKLRARFCANRKSRLAVH